jgi:hypothetical protein
MDQLPPLLRELLLPLLLLLLLVQRGYSQGHSESCNKCAVSLGEVRVILRKSFCFGHQSATIRN